LIFAIDISLSFADAFMPMMFSPLFLHYFW
jgi:hypothetical protein